jgi:hypothetical protein
MTSGSVSSVSFSLKFLVSLLHSRCRIRLHLVARDDCCRGTMMRGQVYVHTAMVIAASFYYTTAALLNPHSLQLISQRYQYFDAYALSPTKRRSSTSFYHDEKRLTRNETGGLHFNPAVWSSSSSSSKPPLPFLSESLTGRVPVHHSTDTELPIHTRKHHVSASISIHNAIRQVHAIFDLYGSTSTSTSSTADTLIHMSPDLALTTLQGVVVQSVDIMNQQKKEKLESCNSDRDNDSDSDIDNNIIMEQLHALVWRLTDDLCLVPSRRVLETLCGIRQMTWISSQPQQPTKFNDNDCRQKQNNLQTVSRIARLLLLADRYEFERTTRAGGTCKKQFGLSVSSDCTFLIQLLEFTVHHYVPMSFEVWELYCTAHNRQQHNKYPAPPRQMYSYMLTTLAHSPLEWKVRQTRVVQDMTHSSLRTQQQCRSCENYDCKYKPTANELFGALDTAAQNGRVQDAAWLLRQLMPMKRNGVDMDMDSESIRTRFFQALFRSTEPGALRYMEKLFSLSNGSGWQSVDRGKLLLQKFSLEKTPGAGKRAQACFQHMENGLDDWQPDGETILCVVVAYLQENNMTLSNVMDADSFVRRCVGEYGRQHDDRKATGANTNTQPYPWPVFDRLLEAYASCGAATDAEALLAADTLFRFFLVQHREGNVAEEPHNGHLKSILSKWKHHPNATGAQKSLEYVRIVQGLGRVDVD